MWSAYTYLKIVTKYVIRRLNKKLLFILLRQFTKVSRPSMNHSSTIFNEDTDKGFYQQNNLTKQNTA